jgi:hypothetical protein
MPWINTGLARLKVHLEKLEKNSQEGASGLFEVFTLNRNTHLPDQGGELL